MEFHRHLKIYLFKYTCDC